jgi:hypothetical protein
MPEMTKALRRDPARGRAARRRRAGDAGRKATRCHAPVSALPAGRAGADGARDSGSARFAATVPISGCGCSKPTISGTPSAPGGEQWQNSSAKAADRGHNRAGRSSRGERQFERLRPSVTRPGKRASMILGGDTEEAQFVTRPAK